MAEFRDAVELVVAGIGPGDLMSYGQVAALAGKPGAARAVGNILATASGLPWWRVVSVSGRLVPGLEQEQARLLTSEGVEVAGRAGPQRLLRSVNPRPRSIGQLRASGPTFLDA